MIYGIGLTSAFDWFSLTPSENITWTPCYSAGQQCARLSLPLDYSTPAGPKTEIALQMLPATDTANYKGTILVNPGGPGDPGTQLVNNSGAFLSAVLGPEFDILGFDPRGSGATTPQAQCFDSESQFDIWSLTNAVALNKLDGSVAYERSKKRVVGERCLSALGGTGQENINGTAAEWGPGRFMDTASVATDMLNIVQKLGQDKLQYAGLSFGSVIGQYFAAMYPDKVGRLVIDGVFDANEYRQVSLISSLEDTDTVAASFNTFCNQAGAANCPLYESSAAGVSSRVQNILNTVEQSPVAVPFAEDGPAVITQSILRSTTFSACYTPIALFPTLADVFLAIEGNNQTTLSQFVDNGISYECNAVEPPAWERQTQANPAIWCSDGDPVLDSPSQFEEYLDKLYAKSTVGGPFAGIQRLQCSEWKISAKHRYTGPLSANTSFPMLLVSSKFDPVCPLQGAQAVQKRFTGSGLLVQNSYGHTASGSGSSLCTALAIRAYFSNGTLPKEGTVCEVEALPFVGQVSVTARSDEDSLGLDENEKLLEAWRSLGKNLAGLRRRKSRVM